MCRARAGHEMAFLPSPPYPNGQFWCNSCGQLGLGHLYHCAHCNCDLHMHCTGGATGTQHNGAWAAAVEGITGGIGDQVGRAIVDTVDGDEEEGCCVSCFSGLFSCFDC
ncbi:hypothetical protein AMTR_s00078p00156660 [Amborella trichopoda]|uniref:DC1 domain-containing protein n=1 Tax=Amborella trichopoda TaxID=13333 RepID=W1P7G0_AMBTC|nr:hypothetical protein AMTR_s00078p00156660 [Amborella trichopoda]